MRLWTLHPKYLDPRGLVALWRGALLAQAVLRGRTRGYRHHPQLVRFRASPTPVRAIAAYLRVIHDEARRRGYNFDASKIARHGRLARIVTTRGQLDYEWQHLKAKLRRRAPAWHAQFKSLARPESHPLFRIVPGGRVTTNGLVPCFLTTPAWAVSPGPSSHLPAPRPAALRHPVANSICHSVNLLVQTIMK